MRSFSVTIPLVAMMSVGAGIGTPGPPLATGSATRLTPHPWIATSASCDSLPAADHHERLDIGLGLIVRDGNGASRWTHTTSERAAAQAFLDVVRGAASPVTSLAPVTIRTRITNIDSGSTAYTTDIATWVAFKVDRKGKIDDLKVRESSEHPAADSGIVNALRRASGTSALATAAAALWEQFGGKVGSLELYTLPIRDLTGIDAIGWRAVVPFYQLMMPVWTGEQVSKVMGPMRTKGPSPSSRPVATLEFVGRMSVPPTGEVTGESLRIVAASNWNNPLVDANTTRRAPLRRTPYALGSCPIAAKIELDGRVVSYR